MIEHEYAYRPSLESCASKLSEKLQGAGLMAAEPSATSGVSLSDSNHFSLSVLLRGASEAEDASTRGLVLETVEKEFPMLRCVEERTSLGIRPKPQWNRAKAVEWLTNTVVDRVAGTLGVKAVVPVYVGDDTAFGASICEIEGGVYVHITGGPSSHDGSYFLREASQADELLRFFVEQAQAGVTVRGGKLRQAERHADESARRRGLPAWIGSAPAPAAPAMGGSRPPQLAPRGEQRSGTAVR
mmetsp:Transcript_591/g.1700  ORF Transcript_591/g.1700 Transcript_591/m.1700 type:complete len:242 (-) Transcript_591:123-848(-)